MVDPVLSLDKKQLERIEQIALNRDEKEALKFIMEIDKKLKAGQVGCNPQGQRITERLDGAISRYKRK